MIIGAWFYVLVRAPWHYGARWLALLGLLFVPAMLGIGEVHARPGQSVTFYLLSQIAVAFAIWDVPAKMLAAIPSMSTGRRLPQLFAGFVSVFILVAAVWVDATNGRYSMVKQWQRFSVFNEDRMWNDTGLEVTGHFSSEMQKLAQWLTTNVPASATLMTDFHGRRALYFLTGGSFDWSTFPMAYMHVLLGDGVRINALKTYDPVAGDAVALKTQVPNPPLLLHSHLRETDLYRYGNCENPGLYWWWLPKHSFEGVLGTGEVDVFVLVGQHALAISSILESIPEVSRMHAPPEGSRVYKQVRPVAQLPPQPLYIGAEIPRMLQYLETAVPGQYEHLVQQILRLHLVCQNCN